MNYYLIAQIGFAALSLFLIVIIYQGLKSGMRSFSESRRKRILRNYVLVLTGWIGIISIASLSGFTSNWESLPPRPPLFVLPPLIVLIFILRSDTTKEILQNVKPHRLMNIQAFRIPVEIFIWLLFLANVTPIQMTFEGRNWDILVGLTAPIFAFLAFANGKNNRKLAIAWNIGGLLLLGNILTVAILSMPIPIRVFMNEPANTEVGNFPVIFLPTILVTVAYYFHAFSLKQLLMKNPPSSS